MQKSQSNREYISPITLYRHMYVCVCVCVCRMCMYVCVSCVCVFVCVCVYLWKYVCMYVRMNVRTYVCMCVYVCIKVCTYARIYVCMYMLYSWICIFTIYHQRWLYFTSICDLYVTRNTILKHFLAISYEVLSFETMHYEFYLQLFHPTPLTTTTSTTDYFVLPKFSATSRFTLGTVPTAHKQQTGLPWASKPYFSVRSFKWHSLHKSLSSWPGHL
jgi:hypothetical protein